MAYRINNGVCMKKNIFTLSKIFSPHLTIQRKYAFTLAEVLITLGIIGVVAALTLPTLISNYQKQQTVVQLKKVYTELSQAVAMGEAVNGDKSNWDFSLPSMDFFNLYLEQFIKISTHKVGDAKKQLGITYRQTSGNPEIGLTSMYDSANVIDLASGAQIFIAEVLVNSASKGKTFVVDINGFKKPNQFGKDLFCLYLDMQNGLRACQNDDGVYNVEHTREEFLNGPSVNSYQCNRSGRGMWCAAVIIMDGWEIKDDYPW